MPLNSQQPEAALSLRSILFALAMIGGGTVGFSLALGYYRTTIDYPSAIGFGKCEPPNDVVPAWSCTDGIVGCPIFNTTGLPGNYSQLPLALFKFVCNQLQQAQINGTNLTRNGITVCRNNAAAGEWIRAFVEKVMGGSLTAIGCDTNSENALLLVFLCAAAILLATGYLAHKIYQSGCVGALLAKLGVTSSNASADTSRNNTSNVTYGALTN